MRGCGVIIYCILMRKASYLFLFSLLISSSACGSDNDGTISSKIPDGENPVTSAGLQAYMLTTTDTRTYERNLNPKSACHLKTFCWIRNRLFRLCKGSELHLLVHLEAMPLSSSIKAIQPRILYLPLQTILGKSTRQIASCNPIR